jgi:hypothetical protein
MNKSKFLLFLVCFLSPTQFSTLESAAWSIGNAGGDANMEVAKVRELGQFYIQKLRVKYVA